MSKASDPSVGTPQLRSYVMTLLSILEHRLPPRAGGHHGLMRMQYGSDAAGWTDKFALHLSLEKFHTFFLDDADFQWHSESGIGCCVPCLVELEAAEAELTRLRAECEHWHSHYDAAQANWDEVLRQRDALLIDLRALVEQWKNRIKDANTDPDNYFGTIMDPDGYNEHDIAYEACIEELTARLSREPHQDKTDEEQRHDE